MMLRIQFAVLALFVVARARPESGNTQITRLPVASNSIEGETCSSALQRVLASISMLKSGSTPVPKPKQKRDDYQYTPGVGAHKLHTNIATWNGARLICEREGGHLAIVNSKAEEDVLTKLFKTRGPIVGPNLNVAWIGIHDMFEEGQYVTILGQSFERVEYSHWAKYEPSNFGGNENCGNIYDDGNLNDFNCEREFGFFCELPDVE